ncbi:AAA family ATPase [Vibrio coralliirubri]|uniref:AAA family ATPase n=1 Tax=Vibrio coralliirubri TaxID=1516159 RepID=UPI0022846F35|nr:AAA family ATPase [Vibrio coralliirubri]MCY9865023.1 AAA family ATPase [Vibrio coralliirubri]
MIQVINSQELTKPSTKPTEFLLKGLVQGKIGILYAVPDIGKSHFVMSLALECATGQKLIGLSAKKEGEPAPVLLISSEDEQSIVAERYKRKLNDLKKGKTILNTHLDFIFDLKPLSIPKRSSSAERLQHKAYLEELATVFARYKLVIVDTVTESIGEASETEDERSIKNDFQFLASKSGASILLVHHVNKDVIRGDSKMNMASGAGLTSLMRHSKYQIGLTKHEKDADKREIVFLKANYLDREDKQPISLMWTPNSTLVAEQLTTERRHHRITPNFKDEIIETDQRSIEIEGTKQSDSPNSPEDDDYRSVI